MRAGYDPQSFGIPIFQNAIWAAERLHDRSQEGGRACWCPSSTYFLKLVCLLPDTLNAYGRCQQRDCAPGWTLQLGLPMVHPMKEADECAKPLANFKPEEQNPRRAEGHCCGRCQGSTPVLSAQILKAGGGGTMLEELEEFEAALPADLHGKCLG